MEAKFPKLIPHVLIPDYDVVLWIDAQVQILAKDYLEMMLDSLGTAEYSFIPHWIRDCIYDEIVAMYQEQFEKYNGSRSKEQVEYYRTQGMPNHFGLWAGTSWIRQNRSQKSCDIGSRWFNEDIQWNTKTYSSNDQLALAYIIWKYEFKKYIHEVSYKDWNSKIALKPHKSSR